MYTHTYICIYIVCITLYTVYIRIQDVCLGTLLHTLRGRIMLTCLDGRKESSGSSPAKPDPCCCQNTFPYAGYTSADDKRHSSAKHGALRLQPEVVLRLAPTSYQVLQSGAHQFRGVQVLFRSKRRGSQRAHKCESHGAQAASPPEPSLKSPYQFSRP